VPELPEAEYMVRRLAECAPATKIREVTILRPSLIAPQSPDELVATVEGRKVIGYARRAKNVLLHLDKGWTLRIQLGMTGHFFWIPDSRQLPRFTRVWFALPGGAAFVFEDSRTFGNVHVHRTEELPAVFAAYGPEPLDDAFTWQQLKASAARAKGPVKPFLLDQSKVVGLGNIWAAESLFLARIAPYRPLPSLTDSEWKALHKAIRKTLSAAIDNTFRVTASAEEFPEADLLACAVYGRSGEPCRRCQEPIARFVQAGRSTFHCTRCQH
jgi:formamidopyrimidine-DNA glycosylase